MGKLATSPLPYRGAPPLQSGGQNQKWPTSGQIGYLTPAVSGSPTAEERGAKSEVAHKWANWLPHPCRIGDPHAWVPFEQQNIDIQAPSIVKHHEEHSSIEAVLTARHGHLDPVFWNDTVSQGQGHTQITMLVFPQIMESI